jgi:iron complex outermembrane receptor protein
MTPRLTTLALLVSFLVGIVLVPVAQAQTGTLQGRVVEAASGQALPGVNVRVADTERGASTARDGRFTVADVPVGTQEIVASFVGYETVRRTVRIREERTTRVQITLSPEAVEAGAVTVLGRRQYGSKVSTSGLKFSAPILDVPQSVQAINGDFLSDQDVDRLDEVFRNVSGVNAFSSYIDFTMRGFRTSAVLVDGTKALGSYFFANPKMTDVQRIEVVKGPSSVLYGQLEPGGMINIVTKEPRGTPKRTASAEAGSYDQYNASVDLTGPLTDDGALQYRLLGDYENAGSFRRFQDTQRWEIAPKLSWTPGASTRITVEGKYYDETREGQRDRGIVAPLDENGTPQVGALPIDWTANEPGDEATSEGYAAQGEVQHAFSDAWQLQSVVRFTHTTYTNDYHEPRQFVPQGGQLFLIREFRDQTFDVNEGALNLNLTGNVSTGPVDHTLLLGGDAYTSDTQVDFALRIPQNPFNAALNVRNPEYGGQDPSSYALRGTRDEDRTDRSVGFIVQDLVTITPAWTVLGGIRYDAYKQDLERTTEQGGQTRTVSPDATDGAFTFRGGVVYQPVQTVSVYGSYSEGFSPPSTANQGTAAGGPFGPTESWQVEGGAKAELFDGRLTTSVAGYQIAKTNVLVRDPDNTNQFVALGEVGSYGLELDAIGSITPNWSLTANYAFNDAEITEDTNDELEGQTQPNAPRHTAALWSRYEFPDLGLGLGGGAIFVGERETLQGGRFRAVTLPSYTVFDAAVYYQWRRYNVQLNVKNLFDERHFLGGYDAGALWPGQPRTFSLNVSVDF